jgi:hypothetical protein
MTCDLFRVKREKEREGGRENAPVLAVPLIVAMVRGDDRERREERQEEEEQRVNGRKRHSASFSFLPLSLSLLFSSVLCHRLS